MDVQLHAVRVVIQIIYAIWRSRCRLRADSEGEKKLHFIALPN